MRVLILSEPLLCLLVGFPVQSGPEVRLLYRRQVIVVRTLRESEQKVIRGHSPAVFSSQRAGGATASIHSDTHRYKRPHNNRCRLVFLWRGHLRCWPPGRRGSPSPWQQPEIAEDTDVQLQLILVFITELDVLQLADWTTSLLQLTSHSKPTPGALFPIISEQEHSGEEFLLPTV